MDHRTVALGLQASLNATYLPLGQMKRSCGLALRPFALEDAVHNHKDISFVMTHIDAALHQSLLGVVP